MEPLRHRYKKSINPNTRNMKTTRRHIINTLIQTNNNKNCQREKRHIAHQPPSPSVPCASDSRHDPQATVTAPQRAGSGKIAAQHVDAEHNLDSQHTCQRKLQGKCPS